MSSAQDLRKRIKSVTNTQQITKAMKMVASARLRRAQQKAKGTEPYTERLRHMLDQSITSLQELEGMPLLEVRPVNKVAYVVVGADKGLAGAYTSNIIKYVQTLVQDQSSESYGLFTVGRKPTEYFTGHDYPILSHMQGFSDKPGFHHAQEIVEQAQAMFLSGEVDEVVLVYTKFVNSLLQEVTHERLLPLSLASNTEEPSESLFYPDQASVLEQLLPAYVESTVYTALLHGAASELGARMTAMTSATDNAGELIGTLHLEYNKLRQASITNEISEIVGGANALQ